ncbi:MAG: polyketide cyclase [Opitutus sp.]|nr:polyketide cyclase [Opitutus sp.]
MKLILRLLGGLAAFIVALVLAAYLLPRHYRVERSIVIQAPAAAIFPRLADMREWRTWGVWFERDPEIKNSYSPEQMVIGAWSAWESKKEGNGRATLTAIEPWQRLVYRLEFPDLGTVSTGAFALTAESTGTRVVWSDEGDLGFNPLNRWFGLFLDKLVGPDFEAGLAKLKRTSEK